VAVYLIKPTLANSGYLYSSHSTYLTARAGANLALYQGSTYRFGQDNNNPYVICETFWEFDLSDVEGTVQEAKLAGFLHCSITNPLDCTHQVRVADWGSGAPTTDDWIPGANFNDDDYPIFATKTQGNFQQHIYTPTNADTVAYHSCFDTASGGEDLLNVGGVQRFVVVSSKTVAGKASESYYYCEDAEWDRTATDKEPVLIIVTNAPGEPVVTGWRPRYTYASTLTLYNPGGILPGSLLIAVTSGAGASSNGSEGGSSWQSLDYIASDGTCSMGIWWKWAESGDVDLTNLDWVFVAGGGGGSLGCLFAISGVDPDDPVGAHSMLRDSASDTTANGTAITTWDDDRTLVMSVVVPASSASLVSGYQIATDNPDEWVEAFDYRHSTDTRTIAAALGVKPNNGNTGTPSATLSVASTSLLSLVELNPAPLPQQWTTSISINAGASSTDDNDVVLALSAAVTIQGESQTVDQMCFSDDGVTYGAWEAYATSRAYQLPAQDDADPHVCTVYVKFRAGAEESEAVSDSIILTIDWQTWLRINGDAATTSSLEVQLALRATSSAGGSRPTDYRLREQGGAWSAWQAFHGGRKRGWMYVSYELGGYGTRLLEVQYRDADLNTSPALSASIVVLDTTAAAGVSGQDPAQVVIAGILVYYDGVLMAELEAVDGSVSADARRTVWRTADVSFCPSDGWTHREIYDLLVTPGVELVIRRGWVTAGGGEVLVSLGRFTVDEATFTENESGSEVTCACSDLSVRISRARWTDPYQITSGTTLVAALVELLSDRWPDVKLALDPNVIDNTIDAPVIFEAGDSSDPWSDAQKLAEAHGFTLYLDVEGVVRLMQPPDTASVVPAYFYRRDELAVVTSQTRVSPMEQTYNGVIATGEGSTIPTPVRGEAWDLDPQSPTFVDGPFGRVPYFYSSPLILTAETAEEVAGSMLERVRGRVESLSWEQIPNPAIVPLDAVELEDDAGALHTYIIDELSIPLSAADVETATARETRVAY
jgi:hypothetical protein